MLEVIFLIVLGLVWIVFASIQDIKTHEVADWLSFSLIIFALGFRFFWSLFGANGFGFFYQGLIGFGIFLVLGNAMYYGRMFAGGDAKLLIALGPILPWSLRFYNNLEIFVWFFVLFLFVGAAYGLVWSFTLAFKNFKSFRKEFVKRLEGKRKLIYSVMLLGLVIMLLGFFISILFFFGIIFFISPYFYIFAKSVDESCMIRLVKASELTEGDWLYKDIKIGGKTIKASWGGLDKKDILLIKKAKKKVKIRQGIPYVPVFLISFILLILRYSFW